MIHSDDNITCSVIICTHNRADSLAQTLRAVLKQDLDVSDMEVIVVDNGSTDDTNETVESISQNASFPVRYFFEPTLGLSHARNAGLHHAQGQIVMFTDDDAIPHKNWARNIMGAYRNPRVGGAGGDTNPIWPRSKLPVWLHPSLIGYLGLTQYHFSRYKELHYPSYPYGVNISFRREVAIELGGFSTDLGRRGRYLLSGEETELCYRVEKAGGKIVYVPDAVVDHVIAQERLTKSWFRTRAFCQGLSKAPLERIFSTRMSAMYNVVKRMFILSGSTVCYVVFSTFRRPDLAFASECKIRMSCGYLFHLLEACFRGSKGAFRES